MLHAEYMRAIFLVVCEALSYVRLEESYVGQTWIGKSVVADNERDDASTTRALSRRHVVIQQIWIGV